VGNRTLSAMFGRKTGRSTIGWRKLHKGDLRNFCFSPGIILALARQNTTWGLSGRKSSLNDYTVLYFREMK
jgi:hypothetical protein